MLQVRREGRKGNGSGKHMLLERNKEEEKTKGKVKGKKKENLYTQKECKKM